MAKWITVSAAVALLAAGCGKPRPRAKAPSPRIVTFSPALTQIVFDMGLGDHVVGVTAECILPAGQHRPTVGDALKPEEESLLAVEPDLLLTQVQPSFFASLRQLNPKIRIEHMKIESLADVREAMRLIGRLAGEAQVGERAAADFDAKAESIRRRAAGKDRPRVLFVMGYEAPYLAGRGTFLGDMILLAGGVDAGDPGREHKRWRAAALEEITAARPEVIVCQVRPGEEAAAREYWLGRTDLPAAATKRVFVVTDQRWSIPSTYCLVLAEQLAAMIHPGLSGDRGAP